MSKYFKPALAVLAIILLSLSPLQAQLSLSSLLDDHMVLQRQTEIPLRGSADAGSTVEASLNGQSASAQAAGDGSWTLSLPAMEAGGPYTLSISSGSENLDFSSVWIGDVWLASGQSNMAWTLANSDGATEEIAGSASRIIPQYLVGRTGTSNPQELPPASSYWGASTPENAGGFSGVAYFFSKHLYDELSIPIGILNSSYSGSRIEPWISEEFLGYNEQDRVILNNEGIVQESRQPNLLYNAMIHPLRHTPIKGVIWYQGESNWGSRETALEYMSQLEALIANFRDIWGEDLPFIWVQLPNVGDEYDESSPSYWTGPAEMRSATTRMRKIPNTRQAVTIDLGEPDVHPTNKEPVGYRLSLHARELVYGENIRTNGPYYSGHRDLGNGEVEVSFDYLADSLIAMDKNKDDIRWFQLEGEGARPAKAPARLEGNKVIVKTDGYSNPVWLRYAWEGNPVDVNLYNSDSLPACPFKVYLNDPGFRITSFQPESYYIDKGSNVLLTWEVNGAGRVELEGMEVDSLGGYRIFPTKDTTLTLKAYKLNDASQTLEKSVTVYVQQPYPVLSLSADGGPLIPTGKELSLVVEASVPQNGELSHVCIYTDGELSDSLTHPPYTSTWTADTPGQYKIWAKAVSTGGLSSNSDTLSKSVEELQTDTLEAEDANLFLEAFAIDDESSSGGAYVDLGRVWTIGFDSIYVAESGSRQIFFMARPSVGSNSLQELSVNEAVGTQILFTSSCEGCWEPKYESVNLDSGYNKIELISDWGALQLDYLAVDLHPGDTLTIPSDSTDTGLYNSKTKLLTAGMEVYPNPATDQLFVKYIAEAGTDYRLEILDMAGRSWLKQEDGRGTGEQISRLDLQHLPAGAYILLLQSPITENRKIILVN